MVLKRKSWFWIALFCSIVATWSAFSTTSRVAVLKVRRHSFRKRDGPGKEACPAHYSTNHGLENTNRRALVMYTFTSQPSLVDRQVEIDNFLFFKQHGMMPPETPTALFSSVDYVIFTVNLSRTVHGGDHGIIQCAASENVRIVEAPSGPCDLCAQARVVDALGGPEAVARTYEYIAAVNSGARGPFYTEAPSGPDDAPPVTWIDDLALAGEKVYTGLIMSSSGGSADTRPFLQSFAFGFPGSALLALQPVLLAGCIEENLPTHWWEYLQSYDADLHTIKDPAEIVDTLKDVQYNPEKLRSTPKGRRDAAARRVDEDIAAGVLDHQNRSSLVLQDLLSNKKPRDPWGNDRKMKCVYRSELQLMREVLGARFPPEVGAPSDRREHSAWRRRPHLSPAQRAQLSPVLSGYMHEGHYFARSLHHKQTVLNMGHGAIVMKRSEDDVKRGDLYAVGACDVVMLKFGGAGWRSGMIPAHIVKQVQLLSLAQSTKRASISLDLTDVLECPVRGVFEPLSGPFPPSF